MMTPTKFRKKPVVIEAMQWDGTAAGATPVIQWIHAAGENASYDCTTPQCSRNDNGHCISIDTLEGRMTASAGDWIIRGVAGEFYPCKPDIFEATYDKEKN